MNYKAKANEFLKLLNDFRAVTVISHIRPDGDTIGSAIALFNSLKLMGKQVELVCIDSDLPLKFNFLNGFERYKTKIDYKDSLIVTLDCADVSRVGFNLEGRAIVNIDHHKSNTNFGVLNIVEVEVSTTVVLFKLLKEGFKIDKSVAKALYTGLLTDSQSFSTSLVTKESFKIASELLEYGVDASFVAQMVRKRDSLAHIRLIARAIESLQLFKDGKVALMAINKDDLKATGAKISDTDGIIDFGISLVTVDIAILIVEIDGSLKVSLRSKKIDISQLAINFGGGGHKNASGFEQKSDIKSLKNKILKYIEDKICVEEE